MWIAEKESELPSPASASGRAAEENWWGAGPDCVLRRMGDLLVEYKASYQAAVGVVMTAIGEQSTVTRHRIDTRWQCVENVTWVLQITLMRSCLWTQMVAKSSAKPAHWPRRLRTDPLRLQSKL